MKPLIPRNNDLSRFAQGILKTGFPLEYRTALSLKRAGWSVISSKYYLDDITEVPREIDLIAYKTTLIKGIQVYTTLIISCKKSENDTWALLSRDADHSNPNTDWWPLHLWSNNNAINFQIAKKGEKQKFHENAMRRGVKDALKLPDVEMFAFQIMNSTSGNAQNDKPIYDSIASLVQAQAYELSALPERRKEPAVYQFNLLTVVDAGMVRLHFNNEDVTPVVVNSEHYIARYIVKKQQAFSRIHFVEANAFNALLPDYDRLHCANAAIFKEMDSDFYVDALKSWEKISLYLDNFRREIRWPLYYLIPTPLRSENMLDGIDVGWDNRENQAEVNFYAANDELLDFLNSDPRCKAIAAKALESVYRYTGPFKFYEGIPF